MCVVLHVGYKSRCMHVSWDARVQSRAEMLSQPHRSLLVRTKYKLAWPKTLWPFVDSMFVCTHIRHRGTVNKSLKISIV